jgi:hypothetical protein
LGWPHCAQSTRFAPLVSAGPLVVLRVGAGGVWLDTPTFNTRLFRKGEAQTWQARFSPDSRALLLYVTANVELWDVASGTERKLNVGRGIPLGVYHGTFSPNCDCVALVGAVELAMCDVSSGHVLWTRNVRVPKGLAIDVRFTDDPALLVVYPVNAEQYELLETRTGNTRRTLPKADYWEFHGRRVMLINTVDREPGALEKLLGKWWPFEAKPGIGQVRVLDVISGEELARVESGLEVGPFTLGGQLSEDGGTLLTFHHEDGQSLLKCWDVPMGSRRVLAIGLPLGLGAVLVGLSAGCRFARRRMNTRRRVQPSC